MIATPPLPYRVRVIGSSHKCLCEETRGGEKCDWVLSHITSPLGSGRWYGGSGGGSLNWPILLYSETNDRDTRCRWTCKFPPLTQMLALLCGVAFTAVCVVLLDGGEGLEEFSQVNLRVAAGSQGFVWHLLQLSIHFFFSVPILCTTWRWRKERKGGLVLLELSGRSARSSAASKSILQASAICACQTSEWFANDDSHLYPSLWWGSAAFCWKRNGTAGFVSSLTNTKSV